MSSRVRRTRIVAATALAVAAIGTWILLMGSPPPAARVQVPPGGTDETAHAMLMSSDGEQPSPAPEPALPSAATTETRATCQVRGVVTTAGDRDVPVGMRVLVLTLSGDPLHSIPVAADGSFRDTVELPSSPTRCRVFATGSAGGDGLSFSVERELESGTDESFLLVVRDAGTFLARAVDEAGEPLANATFLLFERPHKDSGILPTWEYECVASAFRRLQTDGEGRVSTLVRPGAVEARVLGPEGTAGARRTVELAAGEHVDAGDFKVPRPGASIRGRVVSARTGDGIPGAWVQLSDEGLRFGSSQAVGAVPSIQADSEGRFRIDGVGLDVAPFTIAAGAAAYDVASVMTTQRNGELELRLEPRPTLRVQLALPGGGSLSELAAVAEEGVWSIEKLGGRTPFRQHPMVHERDPVAFLEEGLAGPTQFESAGAPGLFVGAAPARGSYRVRLWLPGGAVGVAEVHLAAAGQAEPAHMEFPAGRRVRVVIRAAGDMAEERGVTLDLLWLGATTPTATGIRAARGALREWSKGLELWMPASAAGARVVGPYGELTPFEAEDVDIPSAGTVTVALSRKPEAARVEFQLTLRDRALGLTDCGIYVAPAMPSRAGGGGRSLLSSPDGRVSLHLPPGTYRAAALRRLGATRWTTFSVPPADPAPIEVSLTP